MLVNKTQLIDVFGISHQTFTVYQKDSEFPVLYDGAVGESNRYDTKEVYKYLVALELKRAQKVSAKERLDGIRADRELLAYAVDMKELTPVIETVKLLNRTFTALRTAILNSGSKLKTEIDSLYDVNVDPELLDEHNRALLTHLSQIKLQPVGDHPAESEPARATA